MQNKFENTLDNKRYYTLNYYFKTNFKNKVCKVPINGFFSCPNRDGTKGIGGCTFCSELGSGEFQKGSTQDYLTQYHEGHLIMSKKWANSYTIPYFQSFTNTYGTLEKIKSMVQPFLLLDEVKAIDLATRADCLSDEIIEYLDECTKIKDIYLELGLQSIHDNTANLINRCHTYQDFKDIMKKLENTNIKVIVHLMNGLPYETYDMMIQSAKDLNQFKLFGVKIHMLHIIKDTTIYHQYQNQPFHLLTLEEYVDICVMQLRHLNKDIIIQRITGDGEKDTLFAPLWTLNKTVVINEIDKFMAKNDVYQGDLFNN